jgi:hypothetical protein
LLKQRHCQELVHADEAGADAVLELSLDNKTFTEVGRRTMPFRQTVPWVASLDHQLARYIRVKGKPHGYVALSELEAYER